MRNKVSVVLALAVLCGLAMATTASATTLCYTLSGLSLNGGTLDIKDDALIITDPTQTTYVDSSGTFIGYAAIRQACQDSFNNGLNTFGTPFDAAGVSQQRCRDQ